MIELDETYRPMTDEETAEYARCTCLDRARMALEQTGQVHCAGVMGELQKEFDDISTVSGISANKPMELLDWLVDGAVGLANKIEHYEAQG